MAALFGKQRTVRITQKKEKSIRGRKRSASSGRCQVTAAVLRNRLHLFVSFCCFFFSLFKRWRVDSFSFRNLALAIERSVQNIWKKTMSRGPVASVLLYTVFSTTRSKLHVTYQRAYFRRCVRKCENLSINLSNSCAQSRLSTRG